MVDAIDMAAEKMMREGFNVRTTLGRRGLARRGFTLLELMVVMAIIVILMTIATAKFEQMVVRAREATLRSDLKVLRQSVQD
ncbi:MAG: prepilin-type N-terminal cleavage/methylation domain-containing protein, partial [Candidatus Acidiferrales bacterium]